MVFVKVVAQPLHVPDQRAEFIIWLCFGTLLGGAVVAGAAAASARVRPIWVGCAWLACASAAALGLLTGNAAAAVLGLIQWVLWLVFSGRGAGRAAQLGTLAASGLAWAVGLTLIFWAKPDSWILRDGPYPPLIACLALYLVAAKVFRSEAREGKAKPLISLIGLLLAAVLLGFGAAHTDPNFSGSAGHHWGFYTDPAGLIRQGGVPLWDVPSQYGFLSVITIATIPVHSVWQALYELNTLMNLLFALTLFLLIRAPGGDAIDQVVAMLLAFSMVFLRVLAAGPYLAVQTFPSAGGMRFEWALLLLWIVVRSARTAAAAPPSRLWMAAGCAVWLVGCLWSVESAVYCSLTWLPAFGLLAWRDPRRARILALPPIAAAGVAAIATAVLWVRLGHPPDPLGYFDFAASYAGGFAYIEANPIGPLWVLLAVTALCLSALVGRGGPPLAIGLAAAGLVWSTGTYYIGRSHSSNLINLMPMLLAAALVLFRLRPRWERPVLSQLLAALMATLLIGPLADEPALVRFLSAPPFPAGGIDGLRPSAEPGLQALMTRAGVGPDDPIVYLGDETYATPMPIWRAGAVIVPETRQWLPAPVELNVLSPSRRELYLERARARYPDGGWLVEADQHPALQAEWLRPWLYARYQPSETAEGGGWRLTRYRRRPNA